MPAATNRQLAVRLAVSRALGRTRDLDGVYSADPKKVPGAERYDTLSYHEVLARDLQVMDASAISLSRENAIPILVFSIRDILLSPLR